jgi:hypothetical protein
LGRNLEVFNTLPRVKQPGHRSGKSYAARNPRHGPYDWLAWRNTTGARLLPHVAAPALHKLFDGVEADVLESNPALADFLPEREPSPWLYIDGEWWPKADAEPTV